MCATSLLKFQLQLLGIFHWGEIHRRVKCLICADALAVSEKPLESQTSYLLVEYGCNENGELRLSDMEFDLYEEDEAGFHELYGNGSTELNLSEDRSAGGNEPESCVVCESLQWDGDGKKIYNVAEIVPGSCCRVAGTVISNVFMALLMVGICYNTWVYIALLFGREDEIMHLTSYMTFSFALIGVTLICLYAKLRYYLSFGSYLDTEYGPIYWGWCGVLHQDYVARRLQYFYHGGGFRIPNRTYLASCLLWPIVNTALQGFYLVELITRLKKFSWVVQGTEIAFVTLGMLLFGTFSHTLYLLRHSFEVECNLLLAFIVQHEGNLDRCRMRLADTYRDYRLLRSALGTWMPFIIALGVLGLTVHINWNYNVYSGHEKLQSSYAEVIALNVLIFSDKVMCLALPLIAVGGADLSYIWRQFHYALSRYRRSRHEYFWDRLMWYTRELDENDRPTGVALFLSVISLYTGLKLCSQNLDYAKDLN